MYSKCEIHTRLQKTVPKKVNISINGHQQMNEQTKYALYIQKLITSCPIPTKNVEGHPSNRRRTPPDGNLRLHKGRAEQETMTTYINTLSPLIIQMTSESHEKSFKLLNENENNASEYVQFP